MEIQSMVHITAAIIFCCVLLAKTLHFYVCINRRRLKWWLYFDAVSITNSSGESSKKAKRLQNFFTFTILVLVMGTIIFTLIIPRS